MKSSERREKALIDVISPFPSYRFWAHKMVTLFIFSEKASAYLFSEPFQLNGIQERKIGIERIAKNSMIRQKFRPLLLAVSR
jgi:hypothetical protein